MRIIFAILLVLGCALPSWAIPTISCHCFQDRSYDPSRPDAADDYFLATTQNSLLATVFGLSKRDVVKAKMSGGVSGEDLWVVHYLRSILGLDPDKLLASRRKAGSWAGALKTLAIETAHLPLKVGDAFHQRLPDELIAMAVVDEVLIARLGISSETVSQMRRQSFSSKEIILASFLGRRARISPVDLADEVRSGGQSWGALLNRHQVEPSQIEQLLMQIIHQVSSRQ